MPQNRNKHRKQRKGKPHMKNMPLYVPMPMGAQPYRTTFRTQNLYTSASSATQAVIAMGTTVTGNSEFANFQGVFGYFRIAAATLKVSINATSIATAQCVPFMVGYANTGSVAILGSQQAVLNLYGCKQINPLNGTSQGTLLHQKIMPIYNPWCPTVGFTAAQTSQYGAWQFSFNNIGVGTVVGAIIEFAVIFIEKI